MLHKLFRLALSLSVCLEKRALICRKLFVTLVKASYHLFTQLTIRLSRVYCSLSLYFSHFLNKTHPAPMTKKNREEIDKILRLA